MEDIAELLREDVPTDRFFIGIATMTRPMPGALDEVMPGHPMWMVRAFLQGLRP